MSTASSAELQSQTQGWAAHDSSGVISPFTFMTRAVGDSDIKMKILYCGICHTDLDLAKDKHGFTRYPFVPGHEIVGVVTEVGSKVSKFKVGDKAAVGCYVGSCRSCDSCKEDLENYCPKACDTLSIFERDEQKKRYGGFSDIFVVNDHFALKFPETLSPQGGAPLLCAGITVYSPMKHFGLSRSGMHIGVVGLGGLGHLAVKFGKAFGMKVTVISTSETKKEEAIDKLGADSFLFSRDKQQIQACIGTMDGIIDTVSASHPVEDLIDLLKRDGKLILLGALGKPIEVPVVPMLVGRKVIAGSAAGGLKETQEMLEFAAHHDITADVEVIAMDYVNTAMERLEKGDVRYRFVIDIAGNSTITKAAS